MALKQSSVMAPRTHPPAACRCKSIHLDLHLQPDRENTGRNPLSFLPWTGLKIYKQTGPGDWNDEVEILDKINIPETLKPGKYVLGWRWDC